MSEATPQNPNVERELKFALAEMEQLRDRLQELEAERLGASQMEDNWLLDREDRLAAAGCVLRLRKDGQGARVTYKGPAVFEGGVKIRREHESRVDDLEQMRQLFDSLGYRPVRRYQKMREEWRLGGVIIALDHTPIGNFVEFEGVGAETVARRCGFAEEDAEQRNYMGIYDDYLKENPEAPPDMVFP
jgi:adenylate cyclase class 2